MTPAITLEPVSPEDMPAFKLRLQEAFTQAAREEFPDFPEVIPPERDIYVFGKTFSDTLACRMSTLWQRVQLTMLPDEGW